MGARTDAVALALWAALVWHSFAGEPPQTAQAVPVTSTAPVKPVPRAEGFFGLHFDLHPHKNDTALGADISEENIERLLTRVRPDWVQYDCKGHAGYAGYPTKVGWAAPGIVQDSLAIWRKLTRRHGIGLYVHFSGVWDSVAIEHHPEWARIDEQGKPDPQATSVFSPYVDELMIPQLKEVIAAYDLDGVWVDGDCWAARLDYSPAAAAAWMAHSGYDEELPKKRDDPGWREWKKFHRRAFEHYLCHWVDALHTFRPSLQVTSNWMYTTFAPQPVECRLDFLSGDFVPTGAVDRARLDARYLASTGMPWDLMAWGFLWGGNLNPSLKTAIQLQQEAAVVISQGGAFQVYYQPTRRGYVSEQIIDILGEVANFCRARRTLCHRSTSIPQVALLLGTAEQFERSDATFSPWGTSTELEGALHALLELHYSVDVLAEHQLQPRLAEYPLVVLPDTAQLPAGFQAALLTYVSDGGHLLLLGEKCARLFASGLGVELDGSPVLADAELLSSAGLVNVTGVWQNVVPTQGRAVLYRYPTRDTRQGGQVAATLASHGRGRIAAVYGPVAAQYLTTHHPALRQFIGDVAKELLPEPAVRVDAPPTVELVLRRAPDGRLAAHLINVSGQPLGNRPVIDFIPSVGPIRVQWTLAERPRRVEWLPGSDPLEWSWSDGVLQATVPWVHVHGALVVSP